MHRSIYADVLATLVKAYKQVEGKIGDPTDAANLMGPLNSDGAVQQFLDAIAQAKAAGGTIETAASRWSMANRWRSSLSKASSHAGSILVTVVLQRGS